MGDWFMIAEVARLLKENKKEITFWIVHRKLGAGGNWFAWCRNDYPTH